MVPLCAATTPSAATSAHTRSTASSERFGDSAWFIAGRRYGYRMLKLLCRISISPDSCVSQSESFFGRWGGSSLLAAKFLPGVSVVAPPMAGALGMSTLGFVGFDLLASAIWAVAFLALGLVFSNQVQGVLDVLSTAGGGTLAALALLLVAYLLLRWWRRRYFLRESEPRQDGQHVGTDLDAITDGRDLGRLFQQANLAPLLPQGECGCHTAQSATDHHDRRFFLAGFHSLLPPHASCS